MLPHLDTTESKLMAVLITESADRVLWVPPPDGVLEVPCRAARAKRATAVIPMWLRIFSILGNTSHISYYVWVPLQQA